MGDLRSHYHRTPSSERAAPELDKAEPLTEHEVALVKAVAEPLNAEIASLQKQLAERTAERDEARDLARAGFHEKHAVLYRQAEAADARVKQILEALEPFAKFAEFAVEPYDSGWHWINCSNERICDWFGPTDFGIAAALANQGEGK
jgi:hypothetical protein